MNKRIFKIEGFDKLNKEKEERVFKESKSMKFNHQLHKEKNETISSNRLIHFEEQKE